MITVQNVSLNFGERTLFKEVNVKFLPGNCYGLIGANGAGKSTFLKILSGELAPTTGHIEIGKKQRIAVLSQDQFKFDQDTVLDTVIMGHERLYTVMKERDLIYAKPDFTDEDGIRAADLEGEFAEMGGYEAEYEAATLLAGLDVPAELHGKLMGDLEAQQKLRIMLAQAVFGSPDILLLDEPTNQLDIQSIRWLEDFLAGFHNTVIVVSHDRHFINNVSTHIADLDFGKLRIYVGNYDWWFHASQLAAKQRRDVNKKRESKVAELQNFVQRFSANKSKARQATSRRNLIAKLTIDDLPETSRKFPYVGFEPKRPVGRNVLEIKDLTKEVDGVKVLDKLNLIIEKGDKVALVGKSDLVKTTLFDIIMEAEEADSGEFRWGQTVTPGYFLKENSMYFQQDINLVEWLQQYTDSEDETFIRGFLGRMLFSGEEALKSATVLSGGEKVRCMLAMLMLSGCNTLILDEPTNHLDLEAITALNDGLVAFTEPVIFTTQDFEFLDSVANRIVEITPNGVIDRRMQYSEYVEDDKVNALREEMAAGSVAA